MKTAAPRLIRSPKVTTKKLRKSSGPKRHVTDPIDAVIGILKSRGQKTDDIMRELRGR